MGLPNSEKVREYKRKWYLKNRERILRKQKKFRDENPELVKESHRIFYLKNREKILRRAKEYYQEHKEEISEKAREYHRENREKILKRQREYYRENRGELLKRQREYQKKNAKKIERRRLQRKKKLIDRLLEVIGKECYTCGSTELIGFHEIHGNSHPPRRNIKAFFDYLMKHKEDFVPLCGKCHTIIHRIARHTKNAEKTSYLINKLRVKYGAKA